MTEKKAKYSTIENLFYIMGGAAKWRPAIVICTITLGICEGLRNYVWLYAGKFIIQLFEVPSSQQVLIESILQIVMIAATVFLVLNLGFEISEKTASSRITDVRTKFILMTNKKIMTMPYSLLEQPEILDAKRKSDMATADMVNGIEGIQRKAGMLGARLIMLIAAVVILIGFSPVLVLIMFLVAILRAVLQDRTAKWEKEEYYDRLVPRWREGHYYFKVAADNEYAKDIRIYNIQKAILEKQAQVFSYLHNRVIKLHKKWRSTFLRDYSLELIQETIMYFWLIIGVMQNGLTVADFTLYAGSIRTFNSAVQNFLEVWGNMRRDSRMICDYRYFLEYEGKENIEPKSSFKNDYHKFNNSNKKTGKSIPDTVKQNIEIIFNHVSFQYAGSEGYALKDLSLAIKPGERLAVVGLNGAGKSTFIKLLCRLYEPTEGTITLNGADIKEYDREEYFALISPVFQNVECFAFPLSENISMNTPEKTDKEKVNTCIEQAGLKGKADSLEKGIDTELLKFLYADGIELSGGEKQKMALARALYKESPIVVLDEPTAALDAIAEYETYQNFNKMIGSRIAVYISHRLSSTRFCHHVAMFEEGRMIEYGTHEGLLAAGNAYAKMFEVQAQYYKEGEEC